MKARFLDVTGFALILLVLMLVPGSVNAQSGGGYDLSWTSVDAGGGTLTGGAYSLVSTIGQPEPGAAASGGGYSLTGGVLGGPGNTQPHGSKRVYLPIVLRSR